MFGAVAVLLFCSAFSEAASLPTVDLGYAIQQATLNSSGSYFNFSNIRYAQPPVGQLRFAPPLAPTGRNTTVNDGQQGVICPQAGPAWSATVSAFLGAFLTGGNLSAFETPPKVTVSPYANISSIPTPDPRTSEDCLFLDVIAPMSIYNANKSAPVLVWIYGGGYTEGDKTGSGNPAGLVATSLENGGEGLIFVALNYRLGLFGWLSGNDNVTANAGLLDQRLALEWVQTNIHLFGGDPARVTVIGESAGAGSIMHHITSYGGNGTIPFQQAIPQSPAFQPFVPSQSQAFFSQVVGNASTLTDTTISTAQQLRALSYQQLYDINAIIVGGSTYGGFTFGPVIDPSPGAYVPDLPSRLLSQGKFHNVSVTVGHNTDEGLLFTPPYIQTQTEFVAAIQALFPTADAANVSYITNTLYPSIYNGTFGYTNAIGRTALAISNFIVTCNAEALASNLNPGYLYVFSVPPGLHGEDIGYTFFNGASGSSDDGLSVNATVAGVFQKYLTDYATTGKATASGFNDFVVYGSQDTANNIGLTGLGTQIRDPGAVSACSFWQQAPYYQAGSVATSATGTSPSSTSSGVPAATSTTKKNAGVVMTSGMGWVIGVLVSVAFLIL